MTSVVRGLVRERARKDRARGWHRRRATRQQGTALWLAAQPGRVFIGTDLVTCERTRTKYVYPDSPYYPYSPGELARIYLDRLARAQLGSPHIHERHSLSEVDKARLAIPAPLYFAPERGREGDFVMVDIAACYWSLLTRWPLNIDFVSAGVPAVGPVTTPIAAAPALLNPRPALVIPPSHVAAIRKERALRHAIWGLLRGSELAYMREGKYATVTPVGNTLAPGLVGLVMETMHTIAREAVEYGALMWLTDAGIFRGSTGGPETTQAAWFFQCRLRDHWGLSSTIKAQGHGHLYALGSYRIGRHRTRGPLTDGPAFSNLRVA